MTNYEYLHEVEQVELRASTPRPIKALLPLFKRLGFKLHDDVVSLDRGGKIPAWQHSSVIEAEVERAGEEVFGFNDGEWDVLRLEYLFATLPYEFSERCVETVFAVSSHLAVPVTYRETVVDAAQLAKILSACRDDLLTQTGKDAGSEGMATLINSTYPRRWRWRVRCGGRPHATSTAGSELRGP